MPSQTTSSFLDLPIELQMMIYKKLGNAELMKMAATCSHANQFVNDRKKFFSSRTDIGDDVVLQTVKDDIILVKATNKRAEKYRNGGVYPEWLTKNDDRLMINEDFYSNVAPISISSLEINVVTRSPFLRVLEVLKKWKPICKKVRFLGKIQLPILIEMSDCIQGASSIQIVCLNSVKMMEEYATAKNCGVFVMRFPKYQLYRKGILKYLTPFGGFTCKTTREQIFDFFVDLIEMSNTGNLKHITFRVYTECTPQRDSGYRADFQRFPYQIDGMQNLPTKILFTDYVIASRGKCPATIQKLTLANNMCALVAEWYFVRETILEISIIQDDENMIIDYMLDTLKLDRDLYTGEKRKRYLAMNTKEREEEINHDFKNNFWQQTDF